MKKFIFLIFCVYFGHAVAEQCKLENAVYLLNSDTSFSAGFEPSGQTSGGPLLYISSEKTGREYWFALTIGNGMSHTLLTPINKPNKKQEIKKTQKGANTPALYFYTINNKNTVDSLPPEDHATAPQNIFIPSLGPSLFYFSSSFTDTYDVGDKREQMPLGIFSLSECKK